MNPSLAVGIALVAVVFGGAFVATARAFGAGLIEAGAAR